MLGLGNELRIKIHTKPNSITMSCYLLDGKAAVAAGDGKMVEGGRFGNSSREAEGLAAAVGTTFYFLRQQLNCFFKVV